MSHSTLDTKFDEDKRKKKKGKYFLYDFVYNISDHGYDNIVLSAQVQTKNESNGTKDIIP
jgi:hypothetical protein